MQFSNLISLKLHLNTLDGATSLPMYSVKGLLFTICSLTESYSTRCVESIVVREAQRMDV